MNIHRTRFILLTAVVGAAIRMSAATPPMGSAFTYQGRLMNGNTPAHGIFECEFRLYDAMNGGNLIGTMPTGFEIDNPDGIFTAWVDFGPGAFNGQARWLEIRVRQESDIPIPYTTLSPRQELKPAPYAIFAENTLNDDAGPWTWQGSDIFFNAGRVGIGTSTPETALHIHRPFESATVRLDSARYVATPPDTAVDFPSQASVVAGGQVWTGLSQMLADDGQNATVQLTESSVLLDHNYSQTVDLTNLGLAVPAGATIVGLVVHVDGGAMNVNNPDGADDFRVEANVRLIGGAASPSEQRVARLHGSYADFTAGYPTDLWDGTWTPAQVNSPAFGLRLSVNMQLWEWFGNWVGYWEHVNWNGSATAFIDAISVTVYYYMTPVTPVTTNWTLGIPPDETRFVIAPTTDLTARAISIESETGRVAIGGQPSQTLSDKLTVFGSIRCSNVIEYSSRRFKREIQPLNGALDVLNRLQGVSYEWDEDHGGNCDIGFIAEDVAQVIPDIVAMESDGQHAAGIQYGRLNALTVEAIKELKRTLDAKEALIAAQQQQIDGLATQLKAIQRQIEQDR